jgi:tetratricopeptide (TPR) repeat protein
MGPILIPLAGVLLLSVLAGSAMADTITLKDGRVIQGHLTRQGAVFLIQPDQGAAFTAPVSDLEGIVLGGPMTPQQVAQNQWQVTLYQISQESDLEKIVSIIQVYMKQYPDAPDLKDVQAALAQYVQYQAMGYVKFADQWMAPVDRDKLKTQAQTQLNDATKAYESGFLTQAQSDVQQALTDDPTNTDAMIVKGAIEFRLNRLQDALTVFNKALNTDPNNVVALNDAAIASYQTNLQPHALMEYHEVLNQAADNRTLLDNIASALINYQGDQTNPLYKNLQASYNAADQKMQTIMAQQGLYRFAASWIDAEQKSQLEVQEQEFQQKKLALQTSYDNVVSQLQSAINTYNDAVQALPNLQTQLNDAESAEEDDLSNNPFADTTSDENAIANAQAAVSQAQAVIQQFPDVQSTFQTQMNNMRSEAQVLMQGDPARNYNGTQIIMLPGDLNNVPPVPGAANFAPNPPVEQNPVLQQNP